MDKINWKKKLSSRKLWAAFAGWVSSLLTAFNVTENVIAQAGIIIAGIGSLVVYILAESYVDGKNADFEIITELETEVNEEDNN